MKRKPKLALAAYEIGDLLKYSVSVRAIYGIATRVFPFEREDFPTDHITSVRAQAIYEWLMTLFKQRMPDEEKLELLRVFLARLVPEDLKNAAQKILDDCGIPLQLTDSKPDRKSTDETPFDARHFHPTVVQHSKELFLKGAYFHAVFEAVKAFNHAVKRKVNLDLDGQALMNKAFSSDKPLLMITPCQTATEKNIQDGYRFLAAGLMSAIRNPLAHEPADSLPLDRDDALDILSLVSYLFKWLDRAVEVESK